MNIDIINEWFDSKDRVLPLAKELIKLSSENPPGMEGQVGRYIADWFEKIGFQVSITEVEEGRPNVIAQYGEREKIGMLLNGHLDVVPVRGEWELPPYEGIVRDGKLYGRGSADMKGGLAAMMAAAEFIINKLDSPQKGLLIAFVSDEEARNKGMRAFIKQSIRADAAIIGEPTELEVQTGHRGFAGMRITTQGAACHSSAPENGVNAIYKMAEVVKRLEKYAAKLSDKRDKFLGKASCSVGTIQGGSNINIVPDQCILGVERRLLPGETGDGVKKEIQDIIEDYGTVEVYTQLAPSPSEPGHPLVIELAKVAERVLGRSVAVRHFPAGCEASFLTIGLGIPTVLFGPGSLEQAHKIDEWVNVHELTEAAKIYAAICYAHLT